MSDFYDVVEYNRCTSEKEGFKTDYENAKIDSITRQYFGDSKYGKFGWPDTPLCRFSKPLIFVQGKLVDYQEPAKHNIKRDVDQIAVDLPRLMRTKTIGQYLMTGDTEPPDIRVNAKLSPEDPIDVGIAFLRIVLHRYIGDQYIHSNQCAGIITDGGESEPKYVLYSQGFGKLVSIVAKSIIDERIAERKQREERRNTPELLDKEKEKIILYDLTFREVIRIVASMGSHYYKHCHEYALACSFIL